MEIVTLLSALTTTAKNLIELVKSGRSKLKSNREAETVLTEIQGSMSDLLTSLLTLQAEAISLQDKNIQLRQKLREYEKKALGEDRYEEKRVANEMVMVLKGEAGPPYFCYNCFYQGRFIQLQEESQGMEYLVGSHSCPTCGKEHRLRR